MAEKAEVGDRGNPANDRPRATVQRTVRVRLVIDQPDGPRRVRFDDGTVEAFLDWTISERIVTIQGTLSTGPGFFVGSFDAEYEPAIRAWMAAHDLDPGES